MKLMAAGAAAAVARPVEVLAAAPPKKKVEAPPAPTAQQALRAEIENQKKQLAETLKVVRAYRLPPGSPPAFVFHALKRDRRARAR